MDRGSAPEHAINAPVASDEGSHSAAVGKSHRREAVRQVGDRFQRALHEGRVASEQTAGQTEAANPPGLANDFTAWVGQR